MSRRWPPTPTLKGPRLAVRNGGLQLSHLRFQKFVGHDQRLHRITGVTTAGRNCFVRCRFKPVSVSLGIWRGALRHRQSRLTDVPDNVLLLFQCQAAVESNRFCVSHVVLMPFDVGLDVSRCAAIAFSEREDRTGTILRMLVFLVDVASYQILQVVTISAEGVYTRIWRDTLTNRLFYEKLFEKIRDREHVDVDALFKDASVRSTGDINAFLKDTIVWSEWGGFKKTMMGTWSFLWLWISYAIFYGVAGWIGQSIRH
jgi:hypothetical protein